MPVFATEGQFSRISSLMKMSDTPERFEFHTDVVTANEAAPITYNLGTVLGKVTATGKYVACVRTAADGSQTPALSIWATARWAQSLTPVCSSYYRHSGSGSGTR
jgi:hypothetical protein